MNLKGYKITDGQFENKYGIGCYNFKDFKKKGCFKLGIEEKDVIIQLMDGTIIDEEYFATVPSQTLLIFLKPGEKIITGGEIIYNALKKVNLPLLKTQPKIIEWLKTDQMVSKLQNLVQLVNEKNSQTSEAFPKSNKDDDPNWFEGLETKSITKEEFMYRRAQDRIRGYFYKTKSDIIKSEIYINNINCRIRLDQLFKDLNYFLKFCDYNGKYFDRKYGILCSKSGEFSCQGKWNIKRCKYETEHLINPYISREMRILFSTWNLDHRIERARTILPAILEAAEMNGQINFEYFGKLLFTLENLRLVHIICHDKNSHEGAICLRSKYIIKN